MLNLNFGKKLALATLVLVGSITAANAGTTPLDTFDYNLDVGEVTNTAPGPLQASGYNVNDFGGDVKYTLTHMDTDGGNPNSNAAASAYDGILYNGELTYGNDSGVTSMLEIVYSSFDTIGIQGPLNLLGMGTAFYFDLITADAGFDMQLTVGSDDGNGVTGTSTYTSTSTEDIVYSAGDFTTNTIAFSDFTGDADFSSVSFVNILIGSTLPDLDLRLAEFGVVPEPTSLAILGLGLLGFVASRRKNV